MHTVDQGKPAANPPRVIVALPSLGDVHCDTYRGVREMIAATMTAEAIDLWWATDRPHDRCRNELIRRFLSTVGWTHLLFVDTDMLVPRDGLDRLLACRAPIAAGPAPLLLHRPAGADGTARYGLTTNVLMLADKRRRGQPVELTDATIEYVSLDEDEFPEEPFTCDATGLAFCLIRRDVLEAMGAPWCRFVGDEPGKRLGEDVYFFRKARQAGFHAVIDPAAMCDHLKSIDITHLDSLYCDAPPRPSWSPPAGAPVPHTLVAVCTGAGRTWRLPTAEIVHAWCRQQSGRVRMTSIDATDSASALLAAAKLHRADRDPWTHLLLLGSDVVPQADTLDALAAADALVAGTLTRGVINGRVSYTFWQEDSVMGTLSAPQNLDLHSLATPFAVQAVDPVCALLRRDMLDLVRNLRADFADHPDPVTATILSWCARVRAIAQGDAPPIAVVPITTPRWLETGLLPWLRIKTRLKRLAAPQPAGASRDSGAPEQPAGSDALAQCRL